jgi:SpoVK/Ycf46/Vps4 family AAA+-type ATPase
MCYVFSLEISSLLSCYGDITMNQVCANKFVMLAILGAGLPCYSQVDVQVMRHPGVALDRAAIGMQPQIIIGKDHCRLPGLYGSLPRELGVSLEAFKAIAHNIANRSVIAATNANRMLLHGPSGTGKTEIAKQFARLTGSDFKSVETSIIVNTFQNSGALGVDKILGEIKAYVDSTRGTLVVFLDEIDGLASPRSENTMHLDTERAMQRLWNGLSEYENEPRLFFIFATNNVERLPKAFLNRFISKKIIKIDNPDLQQRKDLLNGFFEDSMIPLLNEAELNRYAKDIAKIGIGYSKFASPLQQCLLLLNSQVRLGYKGSRVRIEELAKQAEVLCQSLADKNNLADQAEVSTTQEFDKHNHGIVAEYCRFVFGYLMFVKWGLGATDAFLPQALRDTIADKTEGLSTRALMSLAGNIKDAMREGSEITPGLIDSLIAQEREKLKLEEAANKRKKIDDAIKDLQLQELELKKAQQELELRIKQSQLEDMDNKKKQQRLENFATYFRLISELRSFFNDAYHVQPMVGTWSPAFPTLQNKKWETILQGLRISTDNVKMIDGQVEKVVRCAIEEILRRGKELEAGK